MAQAGFHGYFILFAFVVLSACGNMGSYFQVSGTMQVKNPPPILEDSLFLVGWYSYKHPEIVDFAPLASQVPPEFQSCPAVPPTLEGLAAFSEEARLHHGSPEQYCHEPSGANGMILEGGDFKKLTSFILNSNENFRSVSTLDELFVKLDKEGKPVLNEMNEPDYDYFSDLPSATDMPDGKDPMKGRFYYALSYLYIPEAEKYNLNTPSNDLRFSLKGLDDGIQLIANGQVMGRLHLGVNTPGSFSLHKGQSEDKSALVNGVNTIAAIWLDDACCGRVIKEAAITNSQGKKLMQAVPNVIRGYVYDRLRNPISGAVVEVRSGDIVYRTSSSKNGFFILDQLPDGEVRLEATSQNKKAFVNVTLDHNAFEKLIVRTDLELQ